MGRDRDDYDRRRSSRSPVRHRHKDRRRERKRRSRSRSPVTRKEHSSRHRSSDSRSPSGRKERSSRHRSDTRSRSRTPRHDRHSSSKHRRSPSHHKSHRKTSNSPEKINRERVEDIIGRDVNYKNFDIDEQQKRLEKIMQERRERVEKWRQQQKLGESGGSTETATVTVEKSENVNGENGAAEEETVANKKTWTLDDENDDEEGNEDGNQEPIEEVDEANFQKPTSSKIEAEAEDKIEEVSKVVPVVNKEPEKPAQVENVEMAEPESNKAEKEKEEEDDVDPLDAYMQEIQEEVKKYRSKTVQANKRNEKVSVVVGVAKKSRSEKGELIEQNQDAMGYSSGEEFIKRDDELANAMDNLQAKTKQKKLMTISKEDITYQKFRKNFYIEVPEISRMTNEEVEAYKTEMEGIKTKGKGCPRPVKTWAQCGTSKKVLDVLKRNGYEKPTPIQCQAIPAIMSGRDLIGIAKTGSGKTLAFLLPMFRHIMDQPPLETGDGPIGIIMTPTRELATQIYQECRKFAKPLGLRVVAVYGGTPISEQIGDLKPGAEIVVCTPGRMIDMLAANNGRVTNLRRCTYVVLDEADRMFDMGFEPQVMRIIDGIRPDRQTVMFSATFPRIMEALARRILDKPIEVQVGGRSVVCKDVEQNIVVINDDDKFLKLLEILGKFSNEGSAIVFVDKQEHADMLLKELMHASYTCLALHGGIDQNDRDSTIADFKNGRVNVLVATSVAARGLDVKHCVVVINYDCPNHYEDYVHRCGRTGRAGNKGCAYTFITPEQGRYSTDLIKALNLSGNPIPEGLQKLFDDYKQEQEMLGKKVKSSSGFTGKGFKFDEAEAMQAVEKKKFQKAALGLQDSDDEDPEADIDQEIESMMAPKTKSSVSKSATTTTTTSQAVPNTGVEKKTLSEKLELAKQLAFKIAKTKTPATELSKPSPSANNEGLLKGDYSALTAKSIAEQRAEMINAKLSMMAREDDDYDDDYEEMAQRDDEDSQPFPTSSYNSVMNQRFEEELEINDFPQQARWRVTSKEAIASISEYSEAGLTVRGTFFPPGKEPKDPNERKLYLAIEGTSEMAVSKAKAEIVRLIKEELIKLNNTSYFHKGRYRVV